MIEYLGFIYGVAKDIKDYLKWDEKTKHLIETCPQSPQSPQSLENQMVICEDIEKPMSSKSSNDDNSEAEMRTLRTLKNKCPHTQVIDLAGNEDIEDVEDIVSKENKKTDPDWSF